MSILQSRNPAMRVLENEDVLTVERKSVMTIGGTVTATGILLSIVAVVGVVVWQAINSSWNAGNGVPGWATPVLWGSFFATLAVCFLIYSKPKTAPFVAPIHAALQGALVGVATFIIPMSIAPAGKIDIPMVATQAAGATVAVAAAMLIGYASGLLRVGALLKKVMFTAVIGLILYAIALNLLRVFGVHIWNGYQDTGAIGIGFTVLCAGRASLFLILDFQYIDEGVKNRAPKYMEWVGAWGLMVTLVWLYIELLRLLSKLQARE